MTDGGSRGLSRRRFLGLGATAGLGAIAASSGLARADALPDGATTTPAEQAQLASFEGTHQEAILSEPTPATAFVAFDVIVDSTPELEELLRTLTQRMRSLYAGGLPENLGPASPPDDNGVLGPELPSDQTAQSSHQEPALRSAVLRHSAPVSGNADSLSLT